MKHNFYFLLTINLLIATTTCSAMEKMENKLLIPKQTILFELATTPDEKFAAFISNNRVIINGKTCRIMDLGNDTPVFTFNNTPADNTITLHPNKSCFALCNSNTIIIYETETGIKKWNSSLLGDDDIIACMFNPCDSSLFIGRSYHQYLTQYNYNTDTVSFDPILYTTTLPLIDIHPTNRQICSQYGMGPGAIHLYDYNQQKNDYEKAIKIDNHHKLLRMIYSPNGSCIGTVNNYCINIINLKSRLASTISYLKDNCIINPINSAFATIEFHPNSTVLAALLVVHNPGKSTPKKRSYSALLQYLDSNKNLLSKDVIIAETPIAEFYIAQKPNTALSFSPDGTKIIIMFHDKCVVLPVPLQVIYHPEAHKKALLLYELLNNHGLPHDIMLNLLEAFKR
jgi:WD40 repeat protein